MNQIARTVVVIGGGFGGLAAAYDLAVRGWKVTLLEADRKLGGLAGVESLELGYRIERFYHHWFTSDLAVKKFVTDLGLSENLLRRPSNTGLYHVNSIFRLSSPLDLLTFSPISLLSRIRTGVMAVAARGINDWKTLENTSAKDWIIRWAGKESYSVIWEPLLRGKFGTEAENISAVWFWNKLKLRGSSRGNKGQEELLYYRGGFGALIDSIESALERLGVKIYRGETAIRIESEEDRVKAVASHQRTFPASAVLATVPLPEFLQITPELPANYVHRCKKIGFLANVCLVLILNRSLSSTYWLNVADPSFPFVGIIEHTNFDHPKHYKGDHVAYISKYLSHGDPLYQLTSAEMLEYCIPFLQRMFPSFMRSWVRDAFLWKADYSQPIITKGYSGKIPPHQTPISGLWLSTMAQIYPEDRGTNYAISYARKVAEEIDQTFSN